MDQYEYMITYGFQNGTGRVFITRGTPIAHQDDVMSIDELMSEKNNYTTVVTGFQLLRKYRTDS